jgi:magnesium transporter
MDAFASVISNNLNIVMKILTSLTIVMAIPNMVFSFYGMNTTLPPYRYFWVPLFVAVIATVIVSAILYKKKMF